MSETRDTPSEQPSGPSSPSTSKPGRIRTFAELVKFEHSIFALPYAYLGALYGAAVVQAGAAAQLHTSPATYAKLAAAIPVRSLWDPWGLFTPHGWPGWWALIWITVAMVGARSFAFVLNRAVDAEIDARNPRTAGRPIPAGTISRWELWVFALVVLAAYVGACFQLAPITHVLWPVPLMFFAAYPYLKRFTWLCHFWLGVCLGLGVLGGWAAVGAPLLNPAPWLLGAGVAIWTAGFDIIYSTQDYECDVRDGIHSVPADFGIAAGLTVTRLAHAVTVVLFVLGGEVLGVGWAYYVGVAIAAALLIYENAIISPRDLSRVDAAFFNVNGMVAVVVLLGGIADRFLA